MASLAAAGGVNFVRFFFYIGNTIDPVQKQRLVALAYSTARDQKIAPKAIIIRSDMHDTTTMDGKHVKDPRGWHATLAFKDDIQVTRKFHVASHGYTEGKEDFVLTEATHTPEKMDDHPRGGKKSGKVVWPPENDLEEYVLSPIGYSYLANET